MATTPGTITHRHHSVLPEGTSDVDVNEWNDSEVVAGGTNGDVLMRDSTRTDGWGWSSVAPAPVWVAVPYSASNFFGTGTMNWMVDAGDQIRFSYRLNGKTMDLAFYLDATTLSGTATNEIRLIIPGGNTVKGWCSGGVWIQIGAAAYAGAIRGLTGQNFLSFFKADLTTYALGTNNVVITGTFTFELT
jgi:hypothetical protein